MYPDLDDHEVAVLAMGDNWAAVYNPAGAIAHAFGAYRTPEVPISNRLGRTFGRRSHLVHRLDRQVSGLSLVALDPESCAAMQGALRAPEAMKVYYAICRSDGEGFLGRGPVLLDRPLRDRMNRNESLRHQYKEALTEVEALYGPAPGQPRCCLVRARPRTGRYHQIRRHLQNVSLPIVGDKNFARKEVQQEWAAHGLELPGRILLHLHRLVLPATELTPAIDVSCPLPPDFAEVVARACPNWALEAAEALPALFAPPPPILRPPRRRPLPWPAGGAEALAVREAGEAAEEEAEQAAEPEASEEAAAEESAREAGREGLWAAAQSAALQPSAG